VLQKEQQQLQLAGRFVRGHLLASLLQQPNGGVQLLQAHAAAPGRGQVLLHVLQQRCLEAAALLAARGGADELWCVGARARGVWHGGWASVALLSSGELGGRWLGGGAVLCCAVLCCAVLRCAVLCCAVLCCAVLRLAVGAVEQVHA
jgi:hypothetical protein